MEAGLALTSLCNQGWLQMLCAQSYPHKHEPIPPAVEWLMNAHLVEERDERRNVTGLHKIVLK